MQAEPFLFGSEVEWQCVLVYKKLLVFWGSEGKKEVGDGSGIEKKGGRGDGGGMRERMPDAKMFRSRAISLHALWRKEPKREEI